MLLPHLAVLGAACGPCSLALPRPGPQPGGGLCLASPGHGLGTVSSARGWPGKQGAGWAQLPNAGGSCSALGTAPERGT